MKKYAIITLLLTACSSDASCPPGTIWKIGDCKEAYENMETGDFEDDPPMEPDPYNDTPTWFCWDYVDQMPFHPNDIDPIQDIFGNLVTHKGEVEYCPINPIHHEGDPWPAKPYSPDIPELPHVVWLWGQPGDMVTRSRQIANFGVYLGPVPNNHPRAPLYSPLVWQLGATEAERARYNIIGTPCVLGEGDNNTMVEDIDYKHIDCLRAVDSWGVQPEWPLFPSYHDSLWDRDFAGERATCLGNESGSYGFSNQAIFSVGDSNLRGLTYFNAAFVMEFLTDLGSGKILQELGASGLPFFDEYGDIIGDTFDELLAWGDQALDLSYLPNCDPDDALDDIAPSIHCAAWSSTGVCSFGVEIRYYSNYFEPEENGWYTQLACPTPYVGVLPPMDLTVEYENGELVPDQKLFYTGWCQPAHAVWVPGGAAFPPPGGENSDVIHLPLEETGYYRGYLVNFDIVTPDTILGWFSTINAVSTRTGVTLQLNRKLPGGREILAKFGLQEGDTIVAIGHTDLRGDRGGNKLLSLINQYMIEGKVINAFVRRGDMILPTYVMRASYKTEERSEQR